MDKYLARFVLMMYVDMFQLMKRLNLHPNEHGNTYCPFHPNTNTPSSKLYKDKYGWCLFCFNEKRIYTSYDIYEKILGVNPVDAAMIIWNKLSTEEQQRIRDLCGSQEDFEGDVPFMEALDKFSKGEIKYKDLCNDIALKL